jgi:O-antigen/teichoic acid export membrane protein
VSLLRNVSITVAGYYVSTGAAALSALVVASALGPRGAGVFALARVVPAVIAALLGAGITISTPYLVAARKYPAPAVAETTLALGLLLGALGWGAWTVVGEVLRPHFYTELPPLGGLVLGLAIPLNLFRNYFNSIQQGLETFVEANVVTCADDVGTLLLVLPLVWGDVGAGDRLVVLAPTGGVLLSCIVATVLLWRRGIRPRPRLHWPIAAESLRLGLKGHVGRIANLLTWRLDVMILAALTSVETVGCYAVASKAAELFRPLSASLSFVLRPVIARMSEWEARARGVLLYRRTFVLNLVAVLVMAVVGRPLIVGLFGEEFASAVPAFQILLIGLAAHGADGVLSGYNVGIGRPELNTYTALVGLLVTLVGDLALIPPYGLVGAAIASSAAYTAKAATFTAVFLAVSGASWRQLVGLKEYDAEPA